MKHLLAAGLTSTMKQIPAILFLELLTLERMICMI